jgi:hypothetical protein
MMFTIGLAEVVFVVKDVQMAARFYHEVVGLIPQSEADDEWCIGYFRHPFEKLTAWSFTILLFFFVIDTQPWKKEGNIPLAQEKGPPTRKSVITCSTHSS